MLKMIWKRCPMCRWIVDGLWEDTMLSGGVRCVSDEQVRHRQRRKDAAAQTAWTKGQHTILEFGENILYMLAKPPRGVKRNSIVEYSLEC